MFFSNDRSELRKVYLDAWQRHRDSLPLEPLQGMLVEIIQRHPEYHPLFSDGGDALNRDWTPEQGESNPFLHMSMHMAIHEQLSVDRPPGIRELHGRLSAALGDAHAAEHQMMECLGVALWEAQQSGMPPDEQRYLTCVRGLAGPR
jgi:hypothetical protein